MSLKVGEVFAELKLQNQDFDQGVDKAHGGLQKVEDQAERTEGGLRNLGGAFKDVVKIAGGFVLAKAFVELPQILAGLTRGAVTAASDISEAQNQVNTVYGDSAGIIRDWASTAASSLGISEEAALSATGAFGAMFTSMGFTQNAAANMSTGVVDLASDLASFYNLDPGDALEKLKAGLVGEVEPLRSVGVLLNAAAVEAKAMELGLVDANGEVSEGAKVTARYALIMEQTKVVQGDFAKTSDGMANASRRISAGFANMAVVIGERVLPAVAPLVDRFADALPSAIDRVASAMDSLVSGATGFRDWVQGVLANGDVLGTFLGNLPGWFDSAVSNIASMMGIGGYNAITAYAQGMMDSAATNVQAAIDYVADMVASYLVGQSPPKKGPLSLIRQGGYNTMEAWAQGAIAGAVLAEDAAQVAADGLDDVAAKMELEAGRQALEDAAGNLEAMGGAADDTADKIAEIDREMADLDVQIRGIDRQIEDINEKYDEQLEPLEEQKRLLQDQRDLQAEKLDLQMQLTQNELRAAELAALGDPEERAKLLAELELLDIEKEKLDLAEREVEINAQLSGESEKLTEQERERLELRREQLELDKREAQAKLNDKDADLTALQEQDLELKISGIDLDISEVDDKLAGKGKELTDAQRASLELELEQVKARQDLIGLVDEEATAENVKNGTILEAQQKEIDLAKERNELEADLATIPIDEKIARINEERAKALDPLEQEKALLEEQKGDLDYQRAQWQLIATDIDKALVPLQEAADLQEQMARDAEKQAKEMERVASAAEREAEAARKKSEAASMDNSFEARQARLAGTGTPCAPGWVMDKWGACFNPAEEAEKAQKALEKEAEKQASKADAGAPVFDAQAAEDLILGGKQDVTTPTSPVAAGRDTLSLDALPEKPESMGARMGALFADGFINRIGELIKQNMGRVLGASIGAAIGGITLGVISGGTLGPIGAAIGGALGGLIGGSLQDALADRDIDFGVIVEGIQEKFDQHVRPVFDRFHEWLVGGQENVQGFGDTVRGIFATYIEPALRRVYEDLLPAFRDAWARIEPEVEPALQNIARMFEWMSEQIEIHWGSIKAVVEPTWAFVRRVIEDAVGNASRFIAATLLIIQGDWEGAWTEIKGALQTTWDGISDLVELGVLAVQKFIEDAIPVIWDYLAEWGAAFYDWVEPQIDPMLSELGKLLARFGSWIIDTAVPVLHEKLTEWEAAFYDWVAKVVPPLLEEMGRLLVALSDWAHGTALPAIVKRVQEWRDAFTEWLDDTVRPAIIAKLKDLVDSLTYWLDNTARPAIREKLAGWRDAFTDWLDNTVRPAINKKLNGILDAITSWVSDNLQAVKNAAFDLGEGLLDGIAQGIYDTFDETLGRALDWAADKVPDVLKKLWDITSPSKVMMPIGADVIRGVMVGAEGQERALSDTLTRVARAATDGMRLPAMAIPSSRMAIPAAAMAGTLSETQTNTGGRHGRNQGATTVVVPINVGGREAERWVIDVVNGQSRRVY